MKKTEMIFLLGLSGSGKDTIGQEFVNKGYTRVAFADVLKEEYATLHKLDVLLLHEQGIIKEEHRVGIIEYAEARRKEDPLYWVKKAIAPYLNPNNQIKENLKLVFTDVRRESEINWIYDFKSTCHMFESIDDSEYYVQTKLFLIQRSSVVDFDVLSHEAIGYARGINRTSRFPLLDAIIINDDSKEILLKKVERLCEAYAF